MTEREKMVGLVKEICNTVVKACGCSDMLPTYSFCKNAVYESFADYLIANGVTVQNWQDAKTNPPKSGEHVLLCCEIRRSDGSAVKRYVCDGFYAAKHTETVFYCGDDITCSKGGTRLSKTGTTTTVSSLQISLSVGCPCLNR